ncbi:transcriptional regulator [Sneathiella chungangensis]|uniref:Transcriptional regulator n=1 Tax=Sneathiella chungangensis TaxID=1418234 RepID=A0A845MK00_9PROT|nr:helix-turn-helix domain-containing protein [Sneathiella chungangensis]MZR24081.1 transcriptional regulator [Sneathiella chungangensis]
MDQKKPGTRVRGSTTGRPVMVLFDVLGQRWTLRILWELRHGRLNFRDLRGRCDDISPTVLNARLKTLRELGFVDHDTDGYGYTALGADLAKKLATFDRWAENWAQSLDKS